MSVIANNLPKFENDIQSYENVCKELRTDYEMLIKHMTALNTMWTGEAHDTLMESFAQDRDAAMGVLEFLEEIKTKLTYADNEYSDCEKKVRTIIDSINI